MEQFFRVFIVDSSRDTVWLLRKTLQEEKDFMVAGTETRGDRALGRLIACRPDLLITDLLLPGMDGLSLMRALQKEGCLPHVLVVSGFYNDRVAALVSGLADNFIAKPCPSKLLIRHMRDCVLGTGQTFSREIGIVVTRQLINFGIMPHLCGFSYIHAGIVRALEERGVLRGVTKELYREIARQHGTTPCCVERGMRAAIERAWEQVGAEERRLAFGSLFDSFAEPPTNVPFLAIMTEYIDGCCLGNAHTG